MGRKFNSSQPMVVDVMLSPLTEMFSIQPQGANATTVQWYYANRPNNAYSPDRTINPLILVPTLRVTDPDTNGVYTPQRGDGVRWFILNESTGLYDIEITSTTATDDYYKRADGALVVRKNVPYDTPVELLCQYDYLDPRDITVVRTISGKASLTTNRDATVTMPVVKIKNQKRTHYNVFTDNSSLYTYTAEVTKDGEDITDISAVRWYASEKGGTETPIDEKSADGFNKFLCYVSGQGTPNLVVDAMFTENVTIVARVENVPYTAAVEYLQATGTQWIDTDYVANANTEIQAEFSLDDLTFFGLYGVKTLITDGSVRCWKANNLFYVNHGGSRIQQPIDIQLNTRYAVVHNHNSITLNDVAYQTGSGNTYHDVNLIVFKSSGTTDRYLQGKIYTFDILENGTLVRSFIPVRVGNVGYMYDKVSGQLFGNAGTGSFIVGADTHIMPQGNFPTKDYATLAWDEMKMDILPKSDGSGAVRINTRGMTFDTIVNIRHRTLTDEQKQAHLFMNWKRRNAASSTVTDMGWGQSVYVTGSALRAAASQLVYADVTLAGAYERVTDDGASVTDDGELVTDRSIL